MSTSPPPPESHSDLPPPPESHSDLPPPPESHSDLPPPPYAEKDPDPETPEVPRQEDTPPSPKTVQPPITASVRIQEKPSFPPPAYTETAAAVIIDDGEARERRGEGGSLESAVSPLLWLVVILSILMFSPCGYLAFAFTCFAFWTETGGNLTVARYLSSVARICALAAFLMGLLVLISPHLTSDRDTYCMFEHESYEFCI